MIKAGAGKSSLDPHADMYPMPTHFGVCDAQYTSCFCRALAIETEQERLLFLSCELSDWPKITNYKDKIANEVGYKAEQIVISVTHNHSSPCDENIHEQPPEILARCEAYKEIELQAAIEACKQAIAELRPAKIGFGSVQSPINVNRDYQTIGGYWVEAPNEAGYSDQTLSIIKVVDEEDKLIAAVLNHCTHATCIYLQRDVDGKTKLSGNFPGITCAFLEERYGGTVLWTSGAAGDQAPIMSHGVQLDYPDGYTTQVPYPDGAGYLQMEYVGRRHAVDAVRGLDAITEYQTAIRLRHAQTTVQLPRQSVCRATDSAGPYRMGGHGARKPEDMPLPPIVPELICDEANPVPVEMEAIELGDIAIVCVGAELYCAIGSELKRKSPFQKTIVVTHTANHVGYVLDQASVEHKTFQAFNEVVPGKGEGPILAGEKELFYRMLK